MAASAETISDGSGLLTVVIPAYNVEDYVGRCLGSLLPQCARHGVRIVIVVDGATDRTVQEIQKAIRLAAPHGVLVIEQTNQGLSAARNRGLAEVGTEYVCFLDSDDFWLGEYLDQVMPVLREAHPDLVEFDALKVDEQDMPLGEMKITPVLPGEVRAISLQEFLGCFRCYAWARVTRTAIARKRHFPVGRRFEDAATVPWHYWQCDTVVSIGRPLLAYRQRLGSILSSPVARDVLDLAQAVHDAADEYRATQDPYWQVVATRIHQVACGRVPLLPPSDWKQCIAALDAAIAGVPAQRSVLRWLQVRRARIYISLLLFKRLLRRRVPASEPRLFGRAQAGVR